MDFVFSVEVRMKLPNISSEDVPPFHVLWNVWKGEMKLYPFKDLDLQAFCFIFLNPPLSLLLNKEDHSCFTLVIMLTLYTIWRGETMLFP